MATDLEDFRATVEHRRPGRILCHAGFTPDLRQRVAEHIGTEDIGGHYGMKRETGVGLRPPEGQEPIDYSAYWAGQELPPGTSIDGHGVAHVPAGLYHFTRMISPLRHAACLAEIEEYPLPDLSTWDGSHMARDVESAHAQGRIAVCSVGHIYETAWQIRGYEPFLIDMLERPAWAECLLERLAEQNRTKALAAARARVDYIHCGDDVANQKAMMFSPGLWRRMMLSRWARIWREAKEVHPALRVWYHSDGNIAAVIGDLVEAGLDILNPLQPECLDLDWVHRRFGERLTLDGCVGTQSTMPFGTPRDVRDRVRELIDQYGCDGGLILAPTHVLEPEVPLANIDAFFEACAEYGTFD